MRDLIAVKVTGHLLIVDDLGNVLVDKHNAVHPQNIARVITRGLANESNFFVKNIAYGNGGTDINAALDITFNPANDGQTPDIRTWDSQLYNETYREIVDDSDINIGTGIGSASGDPTTVEHVSGPGVFSNELGVLSQVTINATLNRDEPTGQIASGTDAQGVNFDNTFTFDEVGLFTDGLPISATAGFHDIETGLPSEVNSDTDTGLVSGRTYEFLITVDGGTQTTITFTVPAGVGSGVSSHTYGDLCEIINTGDPSNLWLTGWGGTNPLPTSATCSITDLNGNYPTLIGAQTFGRLRFTSATTGILSTILIENGTTVGSPLTTVNLFDNEFGLNPSPSTGSDPDDDAAVDGVDGGVQNDPVNSSTEAERMLTHITFAPVLKAATRELNITYTLTVAVARSTSTS